MTRRPPPPLFLMRRPPPRTTLFPYTTLFRSLDPRPETRRHREPRPGMREAVDRELRFLRSDRKSTRLNSSHGYISYAVFCLKKKKHCQKYSRVQLADAQDFRQRMEPAIPGST